MKLLVSGLEAAGAHVANSNQEEMVTKYVSSFSTGSVVDHEDASSPDTGLKIKCSSLRC